MEEEARRRRERLAALREGKGLGEIEKAEERAAANTHGKDQEAIKGDNDHRREP